MFLLRSKGVVAVVLKKTVLQGGTRLQPSSCNSFTQCTWQSGSCSIMPHWSQHNVRDGFRPGTNRHRESWCHLSSFAKWIVLCLVHAILVLKAHELSSKQEECCRTTKCGQPMSIAKWECHCQHGEQHQHHKNHQQQPQHHHQQCPSLSSHPQSTHDPLQRHIDEWVNCHFVLSFTHLQLFDNSQNQTLRDWGHNKWCCVDRIIQREHHLPSMTNDIPDKEDTGNSQDFVCQACVQTALKHNVK